MSAAAGVPTASQIVDDLVLDMYATDQHLVRSRLDGLSPLESAQIRDYLSEHSGLPPAGDLREYGAVFAVALPSPQSRRAFLEQKLSGCKPCWGQRAMGALIQAGAIDVVFTTNFDRLIEQASQDAAGDVGGGGRLLNVAAIESSGRSAHSIGERAWPLLVKLHGDFCEDELKNLPDELREQEATLRQGVLDVARDHGLVIVGYSGRDDSVMEMLTAAAGTERAFPQGVRWVRRSSEGLHPLVLERLDALLAAGVDARVVEAESFDEVMDALVRQAGGVSPQALERLEGARDQLVSDAPMPQNEGASFPALRLNALPLVGASTAVWRADLPEGTTQRDFRLKLRNAEWRGLSVLGGGSAFAYGDGHGLAAAAGASGCRQVSIDFLDPGLPGHARSLAVEAIARGLARPLAARVRGTRLGAEIHLVPPSSERVEWANERRAGLKRAYAGELHGSCPSEYGMNEQGERRAFAEAVRLHLVFWDEQPWVVFEPFTWVEISAEAAVAKRESRRPPLNRAGPWVLKRWAGRKRNEFWAGIIGAWAEAFIPHGPSMQVHALSRAALHDGVIDGVFTIGKTTAFARPVAA